MIIPVVRSFGYSHSLVNTNQSHNAFDVASGFAQNVAGTSLGVNQAWFTFRLEFGA